MHTSHQPHICLFYLASTAVDYVPLRKGVQILGSIVSHTYNYESLSTLFEKGECKPQRPLVFYG